MWYVHVSCKISSFMWEWHMRPGPTCQWHVRWFFQLREFFNGVRQNCPISFSTMHALLTKINMKCFLHIFYKLNIISLLYRIIARSEFTTRQLKYQGISYEHRSKLQRILYWGLFLRGKMADLVLVQ